LSPALLIQMSYIARRSVVRILRQPAAVVSSLLFPMMFFAIQASGLNAAAGIPGFPASSYLDFALAFPLMQASMFGAVIAGADLARDIESGFFDRLALTPMRPVTLLGGMLSGVVVLGFIQGVVFLIAGLLAGVEVKSGVLGMILLVLLTVLVALGFGALGAILALRTGSGVAIFLSSINLPRDLIEADWFRTVATINPISYLVEGLRSLVITGWDLQALALGFGCAFGIIVLALSGAAASLKVRMARP
jgi:ABC-2 type transport system permease protein